LDFKWGMKQGIKIGYVFKNMPLKLSGFFNYTRLKGKGTTNMVTPPWS